MQLSSKIKTIIISLLLICLCACDKIGSNKVDTTQRYKTIVESIIEHDSFQSSSDYFNISAEVAKINDGYRYYVTIDKPRVALYDVEAVALSMDSDIYSDETTIDKNMTANVGIFEDKIYNMVPNQVNVDEGYVEGVVISGITTVPQTNLLVYVSFNNKDYSQNHTEYFSIDATLAEE